MRGNPVVIKDFQGHFPTANDAVNDGAIPDNAFKDITNFFVTRYGTLKSRFGIRRESDGVNYVSPTIKGQWKTAAGLNKLIVTDTTFGSSVLNTDGSSRATLGAFATALLLQANNKAFLFHGVGDNLRTWDGTTLVSTAVDVQGTVGLVHKFRMFVCNNTASGTPSSQLSYSEVFDLEAPDTALGWPGNTIDISSADADFITAVIVMNDVLFVFKRFSTWAVYVEGSPPWTVRNLHPSIGCVGRDTVVAIGGLIYFRSATGIFRTDGTTFELISGPVEEIFDNQPSFTVSNVNQRSAAWFGDYYIIQDGYNNTWHVYNIENGAWSRFETAMGNVSRIVLLPDFSPARLMTMNFQGGSDRLLKFEEANGYGDATGTTSVTGRIYTKHYDFDQPSMNKLFREFDLEMSVPSEGSVTLSGTPYTENNSISPGAGVQLKTLNTSTIRRLFRFRGPMRCRTSKLEFDFTVMDREIEINQLIFDVGVMGRVGNAR